MSKAKEVVAEAAPSPAVIGNTLPAIESANWGVIEELETTDLLIPKIFHQQAMSAFVQEGVAKIGDWCDSMTKDILCKKDDTLELIVFGLQKKMVISVDESLHGKFKLEKIIPVTKANAMEMAQKPYNEERNTNRYRNQLFYDYFCLIPSKIDYLPYVLSLGSTKQKEATKLNTMIMTMAKLKQPCSSVVFNFKSVERSNDNGKWQGVEITKGRDATAEELFRAHAWYLKSKMQDFAVSEEDTHKDADSDIPF